MYLSIIINLNPSFIINLNHSSIITENKESSSFGCPLKLKQHLENYTNNEIFLKYNLSIQNYLLKVIQNPNSVIMVSEFRNQPVLLVVDHITRLCIILDNRKDFKNHFITSYRLRETQMSRMLIGDSLSSFKLEDAINRNELKKLLNHSS